MNPGTKKQKHPDAITLAAALKAIEHFTDAERQSLKAAIQKFQNDKFGAVGSHVVRETNLRTGFAAG